MIEIILATVLGIFSGIITGLIPGIHVNLVCTLLLSLSLFFLNIFPPITLATFIIAMSVTHTFIDSIPSIYLGAPDSSMALSVLPGHKLLLQGKGHEAVLLTIIGSLSALILGISIIPLTIPLLEFIYPYLKLAIPHILIMSSTYIIMKDKSKFWALFCFFLAGTFGLVVFKTKMDNPLFPMFSGLFGTSTLLISLTQKTSLPQQIISQPIIKQAQAFKSILASVFSGGLVSFLPGMGSAQAAIIGSTLIREVETKTFLIMIGGINTVNFVLSFISLYILDKARNGAIVAVSKLLESFSLKDLILFVGVALVAGGTATIIAIYLSKIFSKLITKVNYKLLCISIICLIAILVTILTGFLGLFILIIATAIGIIPISKNIGRNHLMGCLILPVILYFLL